MMLFVTTALWPAIAAFLLATSAPNSTTKPRRRRTPNRIRALERKNYRQEQHQETLAVRVVEEDQQYYHKQGGFRLPEKLEGIAAVRRQQQQQRGHDEDDISATLQRLGGVVEFKERKDQEGGEDEETGSSSSRRSILRVLVPSTDKVLVWIDLENTRGKTGFQLDHWDLIDQIVQWSKYYQHDGDERLSVIVVADHGSMPSSYYCHDRKIALIFSGPGRKADDSIVQGLKDFSSAATINHHFVITADGELKCRCRRAIKQPGRELHIIDPYSFLEELQSVIDSEISIKEKKEKAMYNNGAEAPILLSEQEQEKLKQLEAEIQLRAQILEMELLLDRRKKMSRKKRIKFQKTLQSLNIKLASMPISLLDQLTSTSNTAQHDRLLQRWHNIRSKSPRKEQTGDRVIMAEQLRRQFSELDSVNKEEEELLPLDITMGDEVSSTGLAYVRYLNSAINGEGANTAIMNDDNFREACFSPKGEKTFDLLTDNNNPVQMETLKIVAISDTHGFENQFVNDIPEGDLLLHLGDFALEGSHQQAQKALRDFDVWLAQHPHPYKVIVRGNHDPIEAAFPRSGAYYITEPTTVSFGDNLVLGAIPYGSKTNRKYTSRLPKACDILATHIPPHKTLDRTYTGRCVGSSFLNGVVRNMRGTPPRLWLCGHIHEGRGVAEQRYGKNDVLATTVINAANANRGRATHLEHGAAVVDICNDRNRPVEVVTMKDQTVADRIASQRSLSTQYQQSASLEGVQELLLAVDLGLKSGVSLFDNDGRLLRYEQFLFDKDTLTDTAINILNSWEEDASNMESKETAGDDTPSTISKITHLAIEGGENYMLRAWADATSTRDLCLLRVSPEEWRSELLTDKERVSGANAKAASRLIARQVVLDFGIMPPHEGKFRTDVAESVCLGMYVSRKIGWINRDLVVRRYGNGNVVVPKK